jgi:hypothetical protein
LLIENKLHRKSESAQKSLQLVDSAELLAKLITGFSHHPVLAEAHFLLRG